MTPQELQAKIEAEGFIVHLVNEPDAGQCAEIESWTDGGVNMLHYLRPFNLEQLQEAVEDFDIDEEIDLHRQDPKYKQAFTIRQSVEDFEDYHTKLTLLIGKLKTMKSVFIVYKTDNCHSYESRDTIGIGATLQQAIELVKQYADKDGYAFDKSDRVDVWLLEFLVEKLQTQGYRGEGEFQIEEVKLNTLL